MATNKSKGFIRSRFNFTRWMGVADLKHNARSLKAMVNTMMTVAEPEFEETFEEAMARLNLSPEDVAARKKQFFMLALVYSILALCVLLYAIHLLWMRHFLSAFMCLPVLSVLLAFCFREHFWYTQLKHKRLGFTFKEWLLTTIGSDL